MCSQTSEKEGEVGALTAEEGSVCRTLQAVDLPLVPPRHPPTMYYQVVSSKSLRGTAARREVAASHPSMCFAFRDSSLEGFT